MKRKFYIIGHNPNYISQAQNALKNKANALEPDIVYKNGDFWVYDSSDPLSLVGRSFARRTFSIRQLRQNSQEFS
jgi:hypothetical protein